MFACVEVLLSEHNTQNGSSKMSEQIAVLPENAGSNVARPAGKKPLKRLAIVIRDDAYERL